MKPIAGQGWFGNPQLLQFFHVGSGRHDVQYVVNGTMSFQMRQLLDTYNARQGNFVHHLGVCRKSIRILHTMFVHHPHDIRVVSNQGAMIMSVVVCKQFELGVIEHVHDVYSLYYSHVLFKYVTILSIQTRFQVTPLVVVLWDK